MPRINLGDVGQPEQPADPLSFKTCWFKKHYGETWRDVVDSDSDYVYFILYETELVLDEELVDLLEDALEEAQSS